MATDSMYSDGVEYDLQNADQTQDIPFLIKLASEISLAHTIAEYACGTLRVTIPLAKAGIPVVGVDLSQDMIDYGLYKLSQESESVRSLVSVSRGDMTTYQIQKEQPLKLIIVPLNSFMHILGSDNQIAALKNFWSQLDSESGYLLVDIYQPNMSRLSKGLEPQTPTIVKQREVDEGKLTLVQSVVSQYSPASQKIRMTVFANYYDVSTGELRRGRREETLMQVIFPNEWRTLLHLCGYTICEEWGNYLKQPFGDHSPRMLFLVKRTHYPLV